MDRVKAAEVIRLTEVGSTNDAAMARLRDTAQSVWVIAGRQTGGRGRRGREWASPSGNLYASFASGAPQGREAFSFLPLAAAVALGDAVRTATGCTPVLKWPNDVLIGGRKVAGILVESEVGGSGGVRRAVLGFGVNVAQAPDSVPAARLADHCADVTVEALFAALRESLSGILAKLSEPDGVGELAARWRAAAVGIGAPVTVRFDAATRDGLFVDLDPLGRLLLKQDDGTVTPIAAGEVFVHAETP